MIGPFDSYVPWVAVILYTLLAIGIASGWAFAIGYTLVFKWWTEESTTHIWVFSFDVTLFCTYYMLIAVWPEVPGRDAIRALLFVVLIGSMVWRFLIFIRSWRNGTRKLKAQKRALAASAGYDASTSKLTTQEGQ